MQNVIYSAAEDKEEVRPQTTAPAAGQSLKGGAPDWDFVLG